MPENFRPILWSEVQPNEVVYVQDGNGNALGPHQVVDMQNRTLKNVAMGETHTCQDEVLLYKQGPFIAVALLNGEFAGIYADIPLEIAVTRMNDDGPLLFETANHRARPIDCLPSDYQQSLDRTLPPGWPEFFGKWKVSSISGAELAPEPTIKFRITNNALAANALMIELARSGKQFSVDPSVNGSTDFIVTHAVYSWMTQQLEDLMANVGGVKDAD